MSLAAARASKRSRQSCQSCRDRKARFSHRGLVRADRDHTLCFECFRRERERQRAKGLAQGPVQAELPLRAVSVAGSLGDRQVAHRQAMLAHLTREGSRIAGSSVY
jgi:hypothetical protein